MAGGAELSAHGGVDPEFEIEADGTKVAEVPRRGSRVRDTVGVVVAPGRNDVVNPAAMVCMDQLAHG